MTVTRLHLENNNPSTPPLAPSHASIERPMQKVSVHDFEPSAAVETVSQETYWRRYRPASELQMRPAPVRDWMVAKEAIPNNTAAALVFTVWVSEEGVIDRVQIDNEFYQPKWVISALSLLKQTPMEPGILNNEAVPSTMTVELIVDNTY